MTGTVGHPFWVSRGASLSSRPTGDHGGDEKDARVSGRWVVMGSLQIGDEVIAYRGSTRVSSVSRRVSAEPVYNFSVEGLASYAVGVGGVLVHNSNDYGTDGVAKAATEAVPGPHAPDVPAATHPSAVGGTPNAPTGATSAKSPVNGTKTPTQATAPKPDWHANATPNTPKELLRKPNLPTKGGTWKNADGTPGTPGESFWHSNEGIIVEFKGQYPKFEPHHGVEFNINMKGNRTTDFKTANEMLFEKLRVDADLRSKLNVTEQMMETFTKNGGPNVTEIQKWIGAKKLVWHHKENMQTMQLVEKSKHNTGGGFNGVSHTGGTSYAESVRMKLSEMPSVPPAVKARLRESGLTPDDIRLANELGIIPPGFPI